jgi:thiol-disulfide isomerase/thioredoxin
MNFKIGACLLFLGLNFNHANAIEAGNLLPSLGANEFQPNKNQFLYIDYWASWCGPCRHSFPWMNSIQSKYADKGLKVIAVNVDAKRADADKFLKHTPANFAIYFDPQGETAKKLVIKTMPTSMLINPEGRVIFVHTGFRTEESAQVEAKILEALEKK